jgi:hypothetical protein
VQDFYRVAIEDRGDQVCAKVDIRQKERTVANRSRVLSETGFTAFSEEWEKWGSAITLRLTRLNQFL